MENAIEQAWRSDSPQLLSEILTEAGGWTVTLTEGIQPVRHLVDVPASVAVNHPPIALTQVYILLQEGAIAKARALLGDVDKNHAGRVTVSPTQTEVSIRFLSSLLRLSEDRPIETDELQSLRAVIEEMGGQEVPEKYLLEALECYASYQASRFEESLERGVSAYRTFQARQAYYGGFFLNCYIGLSRMALGKTSAAEQAFNEAVDVAQQRYSVHSNQVKIGRMLLASVAYETGRLHEAGALLEPSIGEFRHIGGWFDSLANGIITKTALTVQQNGAEEAYKFLDLVDDYAARENLRRLRLIIEVQRIRSALLAGRPGQAWDLATGDAFQQILAQPGSPDVSLEQIRETALLQWAKLLARQNRA